MPVIAELAGNELDESCRTYVIENEDHTLANVLKYIINRYPDVQFCAYTIPHPSEQKAHLRIQANQNVRAVDILKRALDDTMKVCDHVTSVFPAAS